MPATHNRRGTSRVEFICCASCADDRQKSSTRIRPESASGTPPYSYQWKRDTFDIDGATSRTLEVPNLAPEDVGACSVRVTDANCVIESPPVLLTISEKPLPLTIRRSGTEVIIEWAGTHQLQSTKSLAEAFADVPGSSDIARRRIGWWTKPSKPCADRAR